MKKSELRIMKTESETELDSIIMEIWQVMMNLDKNHAQAFLSERSNIVLNIKAFIGGFTSKCGVTEILQAQIALIECLQERIRLINSMLED